MSFIKTLAAVAVGVAVHLVAVARFGTVVARIADFVVVGVNLT